MQAPRNKHDINQEVNSEISKLSKHIENLGKLIDSRLGENSDVEWSEALDEMASNYVQLCGTLAGFSGTIILVLLSPGLFPQGSSELSIILLLIAAFGYTYAAAWSALAPTLSSEAKWQRIKLSDNIFLISNVLFWIAFTIILFALNFKWAALASIILLLLAILTPTVLIPRIKFR